MPTAAKNAAVAELTEELRASNATLLTEYRGLTVAELTELRRSLAPDASYAIVKNTLAKIAAREAGVESLADGLAGPSALAFVKGDAVNVAKALREFAKAHPLLVIKGGVLDGRVITADEVTRLADLESREVLLAKLAGAMKGSLSKAVGLFAAPLSQAARTIAALQEQKPAEAAAATEAPVADEAPAAEAEQAEAATEEATEAPAEAVAETAEADANATDESAAEAAADEPAADAAGDAAE